MKTRNLILYNLMKSLDEVSGKKIKSWNISINSSNSDDIDNDIADLIQKTVYKRKLQQKKKVMQ